MITVKVGGGFIRVDEFINQYTLSEAEKFTRSKPIDRMQKKIKLQSIVSNLATEANESSPIRSKSPVKEMARKASVKTSMSPKTQPGSLYRASSAVVREYGLMPPNFSKRYTIFDTPARPWDNNTAVRKKK